MTGQPTASSRPSLQDHLRSKNQQRSSTLKRQHSGRSLVSEQQSLDDSRHEVVCQLKGKLANLYFGHHNVVESLANGTGRKRDRRPSLQEQAAVPLGNIVGELKSNRRFSLQHSYADEYTYEQQQPPSKSSPISHPENTPPTTSTSSTSHNTASTSTSSIQPEEFLTHQSIVTILTKVTHDKKHKSSPSKKNARSPSPVRSNSHRKLANRNRNIHKRVSFASTLYQIIARPIQQTRNTNNNNHDNITNTTSILWWTPEELQEIHEVARQECEHFANAKNYVKAIDTLYKANDKSSSNIQRALLVLWKHRAGRGLETLVAADKKYKYVHRHADAVLDAWHEYERHRTDKHNTESSSSLDKLRRHVRKSSHTASRETTALASALANLDAEDAAVAYFEHAVDNNDEKGHHRRHQSMMEQQQNKSPYNKSSSSSKKHSRRYSSRW